METIERVYNEFHNEILNHALSIVKNLADAEDIRSEVYVKIQRLKSAQYDESKETSLRTWVYRITRSVTFDFLRTSHQDKKVSDLINDEGKETFSFVASSRFNADSKVLTAETHEKIVKAFRDLKMKYRKIATMYFIRGYEYQEIAEMLNVPLGTIKGMINRSRAMLQEQLKGIYNLKKADVQKLEAVEN